MTLLFILDKILKNKKTFVFLFHVPPLPGSDATENVNKVYFVSARQQQQQLVVVVVVVVRNFLQTHRQIGKDS